MHAPGLKVMYHMQRRTKNVVSKPAALQKGLKGAYSTSHALPACSTYYCDATVGCTGRGMLMVHLSALLLTLLSVVDPTIRAFQMAGGNAQHLASRCALHTGEVSACMLHWFQRL